jgi:hypothetical protein
MSRDDTVRHKDAVSQSTRARESALAKPLNDHSNSLLENEFGLFFVFKK